jgi:hypothetical protein
LDQVKGGVITANLSPVNINSAKVCGADCSFTTLTPTSVTEFKKSSTVYSATSSYASSYTTSEPVRYCGTSDQLTVDVDGGSHGPHANYLIRSDGAVERKTHSMFGPDSRALMLPAAGTKYLAASAGEWASYLVRNDGVALRTVHKGRVQAEIQPPKGVQYTGVSAGQYASYLLRSDGAVDRTISGGKVSSTMVPATPEEFAAHRRSATPWFVRAVQAMFGDASAIAGVGGGCAKGAGAVKPVVSLNGSQTAAWSVV